MLFGVSISDMAPQARQLWTGRKSRNRVLLGTALIILSTLSLSAIYRAYDHAAASRGTGQVQLRRSNSSAAAEELLLLPQVKNANVQVASTNSTYVITVITASRPGSINYLRGTIQSLKCALQRTAVSNSTPLDSDHQPQHSSSGSSSRPVVLVVNTEVPGHQNAAFQALLQQQQQLQEASLNTSQLLNTSGTDQIAGRTSAAAAAAEVEAAGMLQFQEVGSLHEELRSQEFVLELARRSREGFKADKSAGEAASDPASRFWWRSKECLDTAFVLEAGQQAAPGATYVIFLQDDVMLAPGFVDKLASFVATHSGPEDTADVISMYSAGPAHAGPVKGSDASGIVGMAFHASLIPDLVAYVRSKFADKPVDWLMDDFIRDNKKSVWKFHPKLVQHVGVNSSLAGKQQKLRSASFKDMGCSI